MESIRYGNAKEKNVNGIGARKRNTVNAYSVLNIKQYEKRNKYISDIRTMDAIE